VCGRSACTVRRGEEPISIGSSYPYQPSGLQPTSEPTGFQPVYGSVRHPWKADVQRRFGFGESGGTGSPGFDAARRYFRLIVVCQTDWISPSFDCLA
jgi:hypothetical protein